MIRLPLNHWPSAAANRSAIGTQAVSGHDVCVVEAIGLAVIRGRVPVLRDVDLAVAGGESIALIGPNGAGKSTLLKCLAGMVRPNAGRVCWFGFPAGRSAAIRRPIGFAGHEPGVYAELTALENVLFAGRMYGVPRASDRARELLAAAGLGPYANCPVGRMSYGMRQRLAIVRALVHKPRLLVLDEPFAGLDDAGRHWLAELYGQWRNEKWSVCFSSHDVAQCSALADRVVRLEAGRIVHVDSTGRTPTVLLRSA